MVDTGMPDGIPDAVPDERTPIYMGNRIEDYFDALRTAGYSPGDVSKIPITHKHDDHEGGCVLYEKREEVEELMSRRVIEIKD